MRTLTAVLALVAGTLYGAPEADVKARIAELEKKAGDVHGVWGSTFCPDYYGYYRLGWDDATRAKNRADYLTYLNELVTLDPSNAVRRMTLGDAYLYQGRFAEARAAYLAGAALPKADDTTKYRCLFGAAECSFALGDRAGTLAELEALAARKLDFRGNPRSPFPDPPLHWAIKYLKGEYLDNIGLPLSNEAKPFPTPQQATYAETFTALDEVTVALDGIGEDDPRLRLVKTRLDRIGAKMRFGGFFDLFRSVPFSLRIEYGADAAEADDAGALSKPEGYVLDIGERGATIRARDARGLTWGVVSFLQSIDYAGRRVRHLQVRDWPVTKNRGFLGRWSFESLEYALFTKLNAVTHMRTPAHWRGWTPLRDWVTLEMGRQFREFGFRLTVSVHWLAMYPQLPISNPRTAAYRADVCRHYAAAGIDVYFPFDDERYADVPKEDRAKWGTEFRQCDADHVNAIYRAVKKDYPEFRMTFCPPFYWGPDSGHPYPEDREKYLDTLKRLDPEIGVYWTGAQVKGISKTKRQVDWYSELIGRKPWIFQNGTGPHNLLEYTVDPINWTGWHYKGFFEDIEGFQRNTDGSGGDDTPDASLADALWNPEQFEPHRAIRRGVDMLCGDGACEALAQGLADVAYFDKYRYSVLTPDILQEDPEDLRRKYEHASNVWATATARYPRLKRYAGFTRGLDTARNVSRGAKNPPDFLKRYKDDLARTAKDAAEEAGYDKAKGDVLVTAVDMNGGKLFDDRGNQNTGKIAKRRFCKLIRGAQTTSGRFTFRFECDPFPPTGDFEMAVCARDDELEGSNRIRVKANGKTVYEDAPSFPNGDYAVKRFRLPADALVRHNMIEFENLTDGYSEESGTWFSVNYIVLKKTAGAK